MSVSSFLAMLLTTGKPRVGPNLSHSDEDLLEVDRRLRAFEQSYREELCGVPPALDGDAARRGAVLLWHACQFLVFRDFEPDTIHRELDSPRPRPASPSIHYSMDLALRFLPDVARLARGRGPEGPLPPALRQLGVQWPLSSVGMDGLGPVDIADFSHDPCLLSLYVDRVLAREDWKRLNHPPVRSAVRQAIGAFPDLAPQIADSLVEPDAPLGTSEGPG